MQQTKIKIDGIRGNWGVIETKQYDNRILVLLEDEENGDEVPYIIAEIEIKELYGMSNTIFTLVMDCAWNGFLDLDYELENDKTIGELILSHFTDNLGE